METETNTHTGTGLSHSPAKAPSGSLVGPCLLPSLSHPLLSFFISSLTMKLIHIFWSGRIGRVPHSPVLLFPYHPKLPFLFLVFMNIFIWTELRKTKLISPFSHPILSLQTPQSLNLGLLPPAPPPEHLYIVCLRFVPQ